MVYTDSTVEERIMAEANAEMPGWLGGIMGFVGFLAIAVLLVVGAYSLAIAWVGWWNENPAFRIVAGLVALMALLVLRLRFPVLTYSMIAVASVATLCVMLYLWDDSVEGWVLVITSLIAAFYAVAALFRSRQTSVEDGTNLPSVDGVAHPEEEVCEREGPQFS